MPKISEKVTMRGAGRVETIPTALPGSDVTALRPPYIPSKADQEAVPNPDADQIPESQGTARVNIAPSPRAPNGTTKGNWAQDNSDVSVLYQHCAFWDPDDDGIIWPLDTYRGFRAIGFNIAFSFISMLAIHGTFSYPSCPSVLPDPLFRLYLQNIYKCKHGSDTGTYDNEGRFVPQKFEDFFNKYGQENGGDGLTAYEIWCGTKGQRLIMDPIGWASEVAEWVATYLFLWPEDGIIKKEDVRRVYDGSIFSEIAAKRARPEKGVKND